MVKHKSQYGCKRTIYFNLSLKIIKEYCNFGYFFNNSNIKPAVFDDGNEIILANWPNEKSTLNVIKIMTSILKFPIFHMFWLITVFLLWDCEIEAENHFLLKSLAVHPELASK